MGAGGSRVVLLAIALTLLLAPVAQAGKVPGFGKLGTGTTGAGTGQLGAGAKGMAVNPTGAGGAGVGDVYVADASNNRVSQFSGSGTFIRSFGMDVVVAGGADNANEVQRVTVKATAGTFRLTFGTTGTKTTGATGTGNTTESSTTVEGVITSTGAFLQGEAVTGPGIPAGTTIASVGAGTITLSQPATATAAGVALTADLPFNSSATLVQSALNALTTIGAGGGSVVVTGGPGNEAGTSPYVVTFSGAPLKGTDVTQMSSANGFLPLSGGTGTGANEAKVTTSIVGNTGFEICNATGNTCKAGLATAAAAAAGGLAGIQGIGVDPATGNVFVSSQSGKRINVFSATGQFQGAFGWNVNAASPEMKLQFCTFATGCMNGASGGGAGQFDSLIGEGQQGASPAVSPLNGHLLVPEPGNRRVSEFGLALNGSSEVTGVSFVKAFGGDVVPTVNEIQTVTVSGATGGTFALGFDSDFTGATGTGEVVAGSDEIANVNTASGTFVPGEEISGPGIPAGTRISGLTFDSLTLTAAATATNPSASFSAALPYNAERSAVEAALVALPSIGEGNAVVSGSTGGPWSVEFKGPFAGTEVDQLVGDGSGLSGSAPAVAVITIQVGANGAGVGFETCTVVTGCQAGAEGTGKGGVFARGTPSSIAIDSTGAIYTTGQRGGGSSCGDGCGVVKFSASGLSPEDFAPAQLSPPSAIRVVDEASKFVAIDPSNDHVLVAKKTSEKTFKVYEFTRSGVFIDASPPGEAGLPVSATGLGVGPVGFAVGTAGRAYVAQQGAGSVLILNNPPAPKATIEPAAGVGTTSATLTGVAEPSPPGTEGGFATVAYFEYSSDGVTWQASEPLAIGTGAGSGSPNSCPTGNPPRCAVSRTITGLLPSQGYVARLVVSNGTVATSSTTSFKTGEASPTISRMRSEAVGQTSATILGGINPNNRATSYFFEWGTSSSYGNRIPVGFDLIAGSGGQFVQARADLSGLSPGTTYHYRIVAKSNGGTTVGPDTELTTLNPAGLPSNRGIEMVSPPNKRPAGSVETFGEGQLPFQPTEDGEAIVYPILNGLGDSTAGGEPSYLAHRTSDGWVSSQLTPASQIVSPKLEYATPANLRYLDPNGKCAIIETVNPLTEDTPEADIANGVFNLYRWSASDGTYTLITNRVPLDPTAPPSLSVGGATADCSKIVFRSDISALNGGYRYFSQASGLYEWDNGVLRDAGLRPDGSAPPITPGNAVGAGADVGIIPNSVSSAGRVFFEATSNEGGNVGKQAVFVRKSPTETVDASQSATATPSQGAGYEIASPDGSHVFFMANYGLTSPSSGGPQTGNCTKLEGIQNAACALYSYDVDSGELVDISADSNPADSNGAVVQGLMASSQDGSVVYFAARGQLVPGQGKSYAQNLVGSGSASVYRWEDGEVRYIAPLSALQLNTNRDSNPQSALARMQVSVVSQTTAEGGYLLFMSSANIEGNNPDGAIEAYLYTAASDSLDCISCPTDGTNSRAFLNAVGNEEKKIATYGITEGVAMHRPRSLSENGRAIFTSRAALAPGAVEGQGNIYEWHHGQLSLLTSGDSEYRDMGGPNGRDLFITSYEQLAPQDIDFASDLYDFRSGGGFRAPDPAPEPCDPAADRCQGTPVPSPAEPGFPSAGLNGAGNPAAETPKKPKCGKNKVRRRGKCIPKHRVKKKSKKAKAHAKRAAAKNRGGVK